MSAPAIVRETLGVWPWTAAELNQGAWCATTQEHADYCLGVLPPIYFSGGFAVSEPIRDDEQGRPTYLCLAMVHGKSYARVMALDDAPAAALALKVALGW